MLFACSYFLYSDGLFSYAGFAAIEVIAVSTLMCALTLLDAISILRCSVSPSNRLIKAIKQNRAQVQIDYESDNDLDKKRRSKKGSDAVQELGD